MISKQLGLALSLRIKPVRPLNKQLLQGLLVTKVVPRNDPAVATDTAVSVGPSIS